MKAWLISKLKDSPSTKLVIKTCEEKGWELDHISPAAQAYDLTANNLEELFPDRKVERPDFCYIRMGSTAPAEGLALISKLSSLGVPCFNAPNQLVRFRDKAQGICQLAANKVPTPKTMVLGEGYCLDTILKTIAGPPWILKTRFSLKGLGVVIVDSKRALGSAIDALLESHIQILVQEFVSDRSGTDIRVLVLRGKAIAAMERSTEKEGEFRSNLFLGGQGKSVEITEEIAKLAEASAAALGLDVAGVDLLGSPGKFTVAEVNVSPGLGGISQATGRNLAEEVLLSLSRL